jgi:hypothetical protein
MNTPAFTPPKYSNWKCYLFGLKPGGSNGIVYVPLEGEVPNALVRWMMKVCLGCTWVKE